MNTVKSFWLGWGSVCVAGVGAYIFAKKEINADRQSKLEAMRKTKEANRSLEYSDNVRGGSSTGGYTSGDNAGSPSQEAHSDPAPTRHEPTTEEQRLHEKSKYESSTPYRSRKGDRFS